MKHTSTTPGSRGQVATLWQLVLGCLFTLVLLAGTANAQTAGTIETSQSGEFSDTLTWIGNVVPVIGGSLGTAQVDINRGSTVTVTSGTAGVNDRLRIGINAGTEGTFTIQGGTFIAAGNGTGFTVVGTTPNDTGTLNVTSGLGSFDSQSILLGANGVNRTGNVNVSGGTLYQTGGDFQVGDFGSGFMNVTGGVVDVAAAGGGFDVGARNNSYGSVNLSGGIIITGSGAGAGEVNIGGNTGGGGVGVLTVDGGTFSKNPDAQGNGTNTGDNDFRVGAANGSSGTVNLISGDIVASRDVIIGQGQGGSGFLNMSGGNLTMDGDLIVGNTQSTGAGGGSYGEFNFSGGDVTTFAGTGQGRSLVIGNQGTGVMNVTAGDLDINGPIIVGQSATSNANANATAQGYVNQTGGLVRTESSNNQSIIIGGSGYGEYVITGGTLDSDAAIIVGNRTGNTVNQNFPAGTGMLTISGADTLVIADGDFNVGNSFDNNNPVDASEGTVNLNGGLATGNSLNLAPRGLGFYNQTGGTLELMGNFIVGDSGSNVGAASLPTPTIVAGSGFANITGGVVDVDDAFILGDGNQGTTGGVQYQDSREALGSLNVGGDALFLTNTDSANSANNESSTEIGFNGTGFLTVSGGTFLSNHAGAIGTNGPDGNGGTNPGRNDGADVRLGVTNALNDDAASLAAGTKVLNTADSAPFGQLEVSGGLFAAARDVNAGLGSFATGNVIVSGGHLQVDGDIRLADGNDSTSTSSISGGFVQTNFAMLNSGTNDGGNLNVADGARSSAILTISGGSTQVGQDMIVGVNADSFGTVNLSGGIVKVGERGNGGSIVNGVWVENGNNEVFIGNNPSAIGEFNVTGGTLQALDPNNNNGVNLRDNGLSNINVGQNGTGILTVSGTGRIDSQGSMTVGNGLTSTGFVTQTGGFVNFADPVTNDSGETISLGDHLQIGNNGTGFYNMTGGTIEIESTFNGQAGIDDNSNRLLRLGLRADGYGSMNIGGDAYVHANEARIGEGSFRNTDDAGRTKRAEGVLTISGGSAVFDGSGNNPAVGNGTAINIGFEDDSTGTLNVTGGHLVTNGDIVMATLGAIEGTGGAADTAIFGAPEGFYNQTGGTVDVGNGSGGNDDFIVGNRGEGTVNVTGGVLNIDRNLTLGNLADGVGTDTNGAGTGQGIVNISGTADVNVGSIVTVGLAGDRDNQLNVSGGALTAAQVQIANGAGDKGTVDLSGGVMEVTNRLLIGGGDATSLATYNQSGGILRLGTSGGGTGTIQVDTDAGDTLADITGGLITTAAAGGNIDLETNAAKDLTLAGGTLDMRGGDLVDNAVQGGAGNNDVNLSSGAILNAANFDADVNQTGGLIDISADGTQRVMTLVTTGNTTLRDLDSSGGTIAIDLFTDGVIGDGVSDSSSETSGANSAIIGNNIDLTGATIAVNDDNFTGTFDLFEQWDILGWYDFLGGTEGGGGSSLTGSPTFDFSGTTLLAGQSWDTSLFATSGVIQIIPEPSRVLLTVLGIAGIALQRRRRKSVSS